MRPFPNSPASGIAFRRQISAEQPWPRRLPLYAAVVALASGISCSSIRIESQTNPQLLPVAPPRRLALIAMDERRLVREAFEHQLLRRLNQRQVEGFITATHIALGDLKGDTAALRKQLAAAQADAVLITRVTDQSSTARTPQLDRVDFWQSGLTWTDVDNARLSFYGPGGDIRTTLMLESRLYRVADGALLWVGHTGTVLKESTDRLARLRSVAQKIVNRLAHDRVIP